MMSIVCPNVWYTRLLLSFYGVGKEFLLLGSGEELCINSSILPAVIGWNGEDFYSFIEYNSELYSGFLMALGEEFVLLGKKYG